MNWYNGMFGVEKGKLYLWRLYIFEIVENWIQFSNMRGIYLCMLPLGWCILFSLILVCESLYRAYSIGKLLWVSKKEEITVREKDFQLGVDIVVDSIFLILPITITFLGYGLRPTIEDTTWMLLTPSVSLFTKLRRLMLENMNQHAETMLQKERDKIAKTMHTTSRRIVRKRASVFGEDFNDKITAVQNKWFPRWAKMAVFVASVAYALLLMVIMIFQLASVSSLKGLNCHAFISTDTNAEAYWDSGCQVQVPFCRNVFVPRCDCAVLDIEPHNMSKLSDKFVELSALRKVFIKRGRLEMLPENMERLEHLVRFDVSFNNLQQFNVDVLKWKKLNSLMLMFNNITRYNENIWQHPELVNLFVNNNLGFSIPNNVYMPRLTLMDVSNNSVLIPQLSVKNLPALNDLYLNGNKMSKVPATLSSFKDTLLYLGIARCQLRRLENLEVLNKLIYLDARNNSLTSVSDEVKGMIIGRKGFESYFSGNPICATDKELNCVPLCTEYCWSIFSPESGICDVSCDSLACKFDGGECRQNV
eukprot:g1293.t1